MISSKTAVIEAAEARSAGGEAAALPGDDGRHARAHHRDPVLLPGRRRPRLLARIAGERLLRDEAVAEGAGRAVGEDARLAPPAGAVDRVERVDIDVAAVAVARVAVARRAEAVHGLAEVAEPAEEALPGAAVGPVRVDLELRQVPAPVREVELVRGLLRLPRIEAEQRQATLPRLQRPVGAVGRLAGGDEVRQLGAVVRRRRRS